MNEFWKEYLELLHDWPHYAFEISLMIIFDGLLLGVIWPLTKKLIRRTVVEHEAEHGITHDESTKENINWGYDPQGTGYGVTPSQIQWHKTNDS